MENDKDLKELEINSQVNNSTYDNSEYSSKLLSNTEFEDDIFLEDILAFEKSLKENPNPKMYSADEVMKELREIVCNMK